MKFYRGGEEVEDKSQETAFEALCAGACGATIPVTNYCAELVKMANRICKSKQWPPITRNECAMCSDCYKAHREKLAAKAEWELKHQAECWSLFISKWGTGEADDADMERLFSRDFPHLRTQMREWIAARKTKVTAGRADAAAGFGRKR